MFVIDNQIINDAHVIQIARLEDGSLDVILTRGYRNFSGDDAQAVWEYFAKNTPDLNELVALNRRAKTRRLELIGQENRKSKIQYICQLCGNPAQSGTEHRQCVMTEKFPSEVA